MSMDLKTCANPASASEVSRDRITNKELLKRMRNSMLDLDAMRFERVNCELQIVARRSASARREETISSSTMTNQPEEMCRNLRDFILFSLFRTHEVVTEVLPTMSDVSE